jgi:predicted esterase
MVTPLRLMVLGAVILLGASTMAIATGKRSTARDFAAAADPDHPTDAAEWIDCPEGFEAIAGRGCLALAGSAGPLVIYLHGLYELGAPQEEMDRQVRLAKHTKALGYSLLALRGRVGACSDPNFKNFVCWPSNETTQDAGAGVVNEWATALRIAEERSGHGKRYVVGFSNGGFFAGLIAMHALLPFDALAVGHAGTVEPFRPLGAKPPLLLLSADEDSAQAGMIHFDEVLAREGWPHEVYAREGAHAFTDVDMNAALTFFQRIEKGEKPPFSPPLSEHRPTPHAPSPAVTGATDAAAEQAPEEDL